MDFTERLSKEIKKSFFYCRPLAFLSAAFLVSLFFFKLKLLYFLIFVSISLVYAVFLFISGKRTLGLKNPLPLLLVFSVLLPCLVSLPQVIGQKKIEKYYGLNTETKLVIEKTYYSESFGSMHVVRFKEINGEKVSGRAILELTEVMEFNVYDTLSVDALVSDGVSSLSGVERTYRISEDIRTYLTSDTVRSVTNENKKGFMYEMHKLKNTMSDFLHEHLSPEAADYAVALFVGDTAALPLRFKRDMSALGISHILAVSGMHTSMIAAMVGFLLDRARSGRKLKAIAVSVAGLLFMCIAGLSPCVVRTVIMLILSVTPCFFGRRGDSITALMLSAVIICLISPSSILSCSLLLSFFATLGIVLSASYISARVRKDMYRSRSGEMKRLYKIFRPLALATVVSVSASAFTVPVLALYFGSVSFVSVAANFVAVPCSDYSMVLLVAVFLTEKIPFVGQVSVFLFEALYRFLVLFSEFMTKSFETTVSVRYPFFTVLLIMFAVFVFYLRLRGIRNPASPIAAFLILTVIFASSVQIHSASVNDRGEVVYTADKSSEGLLVTSGEKSLYVDIGNGGKTVPLHALGFTETRYYQTSLNAYMFTHYHSSHIGTLQYILSRGFVEKLYLPVPETESEISFFSSIVKLASEECEIVEFVRGEPISFETAVIETLPYTLLKRSTHPPISVKVSFGARTLVFVGSSVMETDVSFFVSKMLDGCKAVIIGHHGPKTKENVKFVAPTDIDVYLSPFEDIDETNSFSGGRFAYLLPDKSGIVTALFSFNGKGENERQ